MQEKVSIMGVWCGWKNLSLGITVRHHSASLVMPISDPRDRFFYPHHTPMIDTYSLAHGLRQLTRDVKSDVRILHFRSDVTNSLPRKTPPNDVRGRPLCDVKCHRYKS